ncbi:hypothetical protein Ahy_B06g083478 [Arachis hypogaea]|uniref:Protein FAR1-RELATED SEQUENCE n=1 Tax=Arachis hypogaea TaxID=3818 RepID=A0A444YPU2_ARAHY|nr:hypothetical protein Ahy_B06g083478 [Arachis hypogaea]
MESNFVDPVCHPPASFTDGNTTHSSDNLLNSCDVEGEKSNKVSNVWLCTDITEFGSDNMDLVDEVWTLIRNTNYDRMTKEPINQSIHCNWEGFHGSRVKTPTQKNTVAAVGCKARVYAKFDRERQDWVLLKAVYYHENRELTMHTKCMIEVNDEAGIQLNKTFLALANEVGGPSNLGFSEKDDGWAEFIDEFNLHHNKWLSDLFEDRRMWVPIFFKGQFWASIRSTQRIESMHTFFGGYLHCKTSLVQFVHEFDNVLGNKEQKELEDDAADSRGLIPCATSSAIERQFQQEYTNEGNSAWVKVEEEILAYKKTQYVTYNVHFDHSTHEKIKRKHTYIKSSYDVRRSDESHNLFKGLCVHFYNVVQEFMNGDDEADMLHTALDDARAKLVDYRTKLWYKAVADTHTSIAIEISSVVAIGDIQGPSKVLNA